MCADYSRHWMMFYGTIPAFEFAQLTPHERRTGPARTLARQAPNPRASPCRRLPSHARQQGRSRQQLRKRADTRAPQIPLYSCSRWPAHACRRRRGALSPQPHVGAGRLARRHGLLCALGLLDHASAHQRSVKDRPHRPQELLDPPHPPPVPRRGNRRGGDVRAVHDL